MFFFCFCISDNVSSSSVTNIPYSNGKYGSPQVQQSEVSSTTINPGQLSITPLVSVAIPPPPNNPVPPTPVPSSIPAPLPPPNHYLPVQPPYAAQNAQPTFYYQPVECDNYCPVTVGGYIEYSVIEPPPPSGIYPAVISQPPTPAQFATAPFVTPEGIYYQQIVPSTNL